MSRVPYLSYLSKNSNNDAETRFSTDEFTKTKF